MYVEQKYYILIKIKYFYIVFYNSIIISVYFIFLLSRQLFKLKSFLICAYIFLYFHLFLSKYLFWLKSP